MARIGKAKEHEMAEQNPPVRAEPQQQAIPVDAFGANQHQVRNISTIEAPSMTWPLTKRSSGG